MEDLKEEYKNLSAEQFVERAWNTSTKNSVACAYLAGALAALRGANLLTLEEYNWAADHTLHTPSEDLYFAV